MSKRLKNEYHPDVVTSPGETLRDMLKALGMTRAELAARMGKPCEMLDDILTYGTPVTPATAMELEKVFGVPACFWNKRERRYRESLGSIVEKEGKDNSYE